MNTSSDYAPLRTIGRILRTLSWVALAIGILGALIVLFAGIPGGMKLPGMVVALVLGFSWFVQLYAFGSILWLLVDIEQNTRTLATRPHA